MCRQLDWIWAEISIQIETMTSMRGIAITDQIVTYLMEAYMAVEGIASIMVQVVIETGTTGEEASLNMVVQVMDIGILMV